MTSFGVGKLEVLLVHLQTVQIEIRETHLASTSIPSIPLPVDK